MKSGIQSHVNIQSAKLTDKLVFLQVIVVGYK